MRTCLPTGGGCVRGLEGTLPEYTLWQTSHIQLTPPSPGRLSIVDLSVRVRQSVGGELESVNRELEESWRVGRDWMERQLESYCEELAWSCFESHAGYDLSGADKPPPHIGQSNARIRSITRGQSFISLSLPNVCHRSGTISPLFTCSLLWNALPSSLRHPDVDFSRFRNALVTYMRFPVTRHT